MGAGMLCMSGYVLPDVGLYNSNNIATSAFLAEVCTLLSAILVLNVIYFS